MSGENPERQFARLNVATSRARCLNHLVCNPALLEAGCTNPRQMQLASALRRFVGPAT